VIDQCGQCGPFIQAETYAMEEFRARPKLEADKLTMDLLRWHGGNFVDCKLLSSEARPALRPAEQNRTHPALRNKWWRRARRISKAALRAVSQPHGRQAIGVERSQSTCRDCSMRSAAQSAAHGAARQQLA
jgi:hypothetical protein